MARIWTGRGVGAQDRAVVRPGVAGRCPARPRTGCPTGRAAGWSGGMLSASKFHHSVSISGPSNTSKPKAWKISRKSRSAVMGRVQVADAHRPPGRGHVDRSASSWAARRPAAHVCQPSGDRRLDLVRTSFASLPSGRPLRRRRLAVGSAQQERQRAPDRAAELVGAAPRPPAASRGRRPARRCARRCCAAARGGWRGRSCSIGPAIIGENERPRSDNGAGPGSRRRTTPASR